MVFFTTGIRAYTWKTVFFTTGLTTNVGVIFLQTADRSAR